MMHAGERIKGLAPPPCWSGAGAGCCQGRSAPRPAGSLPAAGRRRAVCARGHLALQLGPSVCVWGLGVCKPARRYFRYRSRMRSKAPAPATTRAEPKCARAAGAARRWGSAAPPRRCRCRGARSGRGRREFLRVARSRSPLARSGNPKITPAVFPAAGRFGGVRPCATPSTTCCKPRRNGRRRRARRSGTSSGLTRGAFCTCVRNPWRDPGLVGLGEPLPHLAARMMERGGGTHDAGGSTTSWTRCT
jgi:hypothetical protein